MRIHRRPNAWWPIWERTTIVAGEVETLVPAPIRPRTVFFFLYQRIPLFYQNDLDGLSRDLSSEKKTTNFQCNKPQN